MSEVKLENAPPGVRGYYDKGVAALERGNLDYAMDMFEAALDIEPGLLQVRKLFRAAAVKKAKAQPPGKLAAAKALAGLFKCSAQLKKNPLQALAGTEKLLRIDPLNPKLAKANCDAAAGAGMPEVAILTLEILNDNKPPSLNVLEALAKLYLEAERFDLEYKCREQIVRLKPHDSEAIKQMKDAAARLTMGKAGWQKAESYRDVIRPNEAEPLADELGQAMARVEQEPSNPEQRKLLADLQLQRQQYGEAIQTLEACRELSGTSDPQIERKLSTAREHLLMSQLAEAEDADDRDGIARLRKELSGMRIENAARQVERYPNDLQLKFEYGKLLFEGGQHTEAIQQFQQAQRNPQRRIRSLLYMALAFKAKGQPGIAREQLENGLADLKAMDETRKEFLYELGVVCGEAGDSAKALACFREIYAVDIGYRDVAAKVEGE